MSVRVGVVGAGGIGGYYGGRLARAGADVVFLARGAHLAALREHGLRVRSINGDFELPVEATDDPAAIGPCDIVLFCVKSYDTETAAALLPPLLHDGTAVLSLQNGVDNEEKLAAVVGAKHVLGGISYVFATIAEPGVIAHVTAPGTIAFGELDGIRSERAERILDWCTRAGIPAELEDDIRVRLWDKFALICAQAGMTATTRLPIGRIRESSEAWAMLRRIGEEVVAVAHAEGVRLPPETLDRHAEFTRALAPDATNSMYYDLANGNRLELESFHGLVVRRAREHGLSVPANEAVYAILSPWVNGALRS
ncbi:MAG: ketopantoate reductase family protein [Gaiellaceae bacterium]